jgi:DNA-binding CsgD family transcriptional regulator
MHFDLAHFPDFQEGFFSGTVKHDTLEMLIEIRQQLNCLYITHVGYSNQAGSNQEAILDLSVLTTLPVNWVMRYSAKNYYKVDPLMANATANGRRTEISGTVRNLADCRDLYPEARRFLRDRELRGLGNLFLAVEAANGYGFKGVTEFTFSVEVSEQPAFIERMHKRIVSASSRLHTALHGTRNPALASIVAKLLTKREIDCLYWAANGKTDGEIGEILDIARWTVVTYLQNAKNKLGCTNRTSTVAAALALGVIEMPVITNRF